MSWPYDPEASWHLFAFEVDRAQLDELRARLRRELLWGKSPLSLEAVVRAILPAKLVDIGLGGRYEALGPVGRLMREDVDPFEPQDLLFPGRLVDVQVPVRVDVMPWTDQIGPVSWATGEDVFELAESLAKLLATGGLDEEVVEQLSTFERRCRALAERGGTALAFVSRNPAA